MTTHPSEYCTTLPLIDHAHQLLPFLLPPSLLRTLTTFAGSPDSIVLATLHTRRSPSLVCVANMSDFCFEDEVCHASEVIGDGDREEVVSV